MVILNNIPNYKVESSYYVYVMAYLMNCAKKIKMEMGATNSACGLTPDVVKFNDEYRNVMREYDVNNRIAKSLVPKATVVKSLYREYSKLYDMGQRIQINREFEKVTDFLINNYTNLVSHDEYMIVLKKQFENFEV